MDRFPICHPITAAWEGGWSNHDDDPGGATMYGVTQAVYDAWRKAEGLPTRSVRLITKAEAIAIYRKNYWDACGAPKLFPGVDLTVYDAAVNSGVSRAKKWLAAAAGTNDHALTVRKVCRTRLSFMQSLKIWKSFGRGWARRVADIEVKGVAMAMAAMGLSKSEIKAAAGVQQAAAARSAVSNQQAEKAGAATVAGSGATTTAYASGAPTLDYVALAALGSVVLALVLVLIFINVRKRAERERADAYAALAATGEIA